MHGKINVFFNTVLCGGHKWEPLDSDLSFVVVGEWLLVSYFVVELPILQPQDKTLRSNCISEDSSQEPMGSFSAISLNNTILVWLTSSICMWDGIFNNEREPIHLKYPRSIFCAIDYTVLDLVLHVYCTTIITNEDKKERRDMTRY